MITFWLLWQVFFQLFFEVSSFNGRFPPMGDWDNIFYPTPKLTKTVGCDIYLLVLLSIEMSSGLGINGQVGRCFYHFQDFAVCLVTQLFIMFFPVSYPVLSWLLEIDRKCANLWTSKRWLSWMFTPNKAGLYSNVVKYIYFSLLVAGLLCWLPTQPLALVISLIVI